MVINNLWIRPKKTNPRQHALPKWAKGTTRKKQVLRWLNMATVGRTKTDVWSEYVTTHQIIFGRQSVSKQSPPQILHEKTPKTLKADKHHELSTPPYRVELPLPLIC